MYFDACVLVGDIQKDVEAIRCAEVLDVLLLCWFHTSEQHLNELLLYRMHFSQRHPNASSQCYWNASISKFK
eukprot:m.7074 g.7074  ORF g.7074 m.7074 type:complete len:72 (-) comp5410_c0_seq1:92-307(-)